ncbi:hypothetical protein ADL27_54920 [Streptomyces sp. NRRL F-6602]|nr:hypothetical protein ADL27_54920 [Streptomyces sp. NRRL F-6602]
MPVGVQVAARRAEFMAALVRCGGNERMAELQAGLPRCTASNWRQADPAFAAAVAGVQAWLGAAAGPRPRKARTSLSEGDLQRLREMWEGKRTIREIAAELGVSTPTVIRWAGRLGLPSKGKRTRA